MMLVCPRVDIDLAAYETLATGIPEPVVISDKSFRGKWLDGWVAFCRIRLYPQHYPHLRLVAAYILLLTVAAIPSQGRGKKSALQYGAGLIVNIPLPEPEVAQVVEEVAQNTIIRGTKEYNKDEYVTGAVGAASTPVFPKWTEGGKVFYKVRTQALDPRNFKDSGDVGTLAVRYVVQPQGDKNTVLRIDAVFVEDFRRTVHPSNGSVESSEYKDIQDHLGAVELMKKETADALQAKQERLAKEKFGMTNDAVVPSTPPSTVKPGASANGERLADQSRSGERADGQVTPRAEAQIASAAPISEMTKPSLPSLPSLYEQQPGESLEQHVAELRRQVERLVKKPGAPLQSAPFHTATTLKGLEPGTEVLILISTPYWYGVETRDGQHGWIRRDQLEQVP
jgi:polyhydroxyalkanoate synthesis regulator phasin